MLNPKRFSNLQRAWIDHTSFWRRPAGRVKRSKLETRCFAIRLDVPVPELCWAGYGSPAFPPRDYVLKPDRGSGGKGVVICRNGVRRGNPPDDATFTIVERLLETGDVDYKFWCFGGWPRFVQRIHRPTLRHRFYEPAWRPQKQLNGIKGWLELDDLVDPPNAMDSMWKFAAKIAGEFGEPFIRCDFYATSDGPVFGELCAKPRGLRFPAAADRLLAHYWPQEDLDETELE